MTAIFNILFFIVLGIITCIGVGLILWAILNLAFIIFTLDSFDEKVSKWKNKYYDKPKYDKQKEIYLAPVFENHKLKSMQTKKNVLVAKSYGVNKEKRDTTAYFFEIFEKKGSRFYSKGFRFLYFQNNSHHDQFLSLYQKFNEKNPYKDDDILLHVMTNEPWEKSYANIDSIIKYHSHNKTY